MRKFLIFTLASVFVVFANLASPHSAAANATFLVVNLDGAGEGFNDPTPAAPVGGNPGTTLGQQRLNAFQHAANIWGGLLDSPVVIRVEAEFNPLSCTANSAVLGQAGPNTVHRNFAGSPVSNTWYVQALANSLFGGDLSGADNDIGATFSSTIGTPGCLQNSGWYFGLDGNAPPNRIDFVTVLLHELGHGLGFLSLVSLNSGAKFLGFDDAYMRFLENHTTGKSFPQMTDFERFAASTNTSNLHWIGPNVVAGSGGLTGGRHPSGHVQMFAPGSIQPGSSVSHYDTALSPNELMEPSYTVPLHDVGLTLELFQDLGWVAGGGDGTPPARITDLKLATSTQTNATLNWTAPGDDDDTGTATTYDMRFSTSKFTDADWNTLTQVSGEPAPMVAGSSQSKTASGLLCGRSYFFAIKTRDEEGNESTLSNIATAKTAACNKLAATPKALRIGEAGFAYDSGAIDIVGTPNTAGPFTVLVDAATLPPGVNFNPGPRTFTGTPGEAKTFNIAAVITDAVGSELKAKFKLKVAKPIDITTTALKAGKVGKPYTATPKAKNGVKAFTWTVKLNSALPQGSTFAFDPAKGKISVLATDVGTVNVTFQVTDQAGGTDTVTLPLTFN